MIYNVTGQQTTDICCYLPTKADIEAATAQLRAEKIARKAASDPAWSAVGGIREFGCCVRRAGKMVGIV